MKKIKDFIWPVIGLGAVVVSVYLLWHLLKGLSFADVKASLAAIPPHRYALAVLSTLVAYGALAWYDRIALLHLGVKGISWLFVSVCSFTTYALSHNIGASVFSGAVVRYRAYTSKGLSPAQVAVQSPSSQARPPPQSSSQLHASRSGSTMQPPPAPHA